VCHLITHDDDISSDLVIGTTSVLPIGKYSHSRCFIMSSPPCIGSQQINHHRGRTMLQKLAMHDPQNVRLAKDLITSIPNWSEYVGDVDIWENNDVVIGLHLPRTEPNIACADGEGRIDLHLLNDGCSEEKAVGRVKTAFFKHKELLFVLFHILPPGL